MKRAEYNDYRSRVSQLRRYAKEGIRPIEGYIPVSDSVEYKLKLILAYNKYLEFYIDAVHEHSSFRETGPGEYLIMRHYDSLEQYLQCKSSEQLHRYYVAAHK